MTGVDASGRLSLERLVGRARRILEEDLAASAEGRFGIHRNGDLEEEASLRLAASELLDRREVVGIVRHLRTEGESAPGAVDRLIREASFTHLNRLVAIRIAESIDLLPPSLANGKSSRGFREVLEVAPLLASDAYGGYWSYLRLCADELAGDAPVLFDPRNPLLALAPTPQALDELVGLLADSGLNAVWLATDTLGWTYQFFNTGDERRQMREAGAPRTSRELAVRNQFFTPRYVVDFLVQNSLGRRLLEANPHSGLISDMPLIVDPPTVPGEPMRLDQVRVLDPACGSGHFLLGAYDLLERAWDRIGVSPAESARRILPCLYGIDIDPRCAQVASAALMLRARRACPSGTLPAPEVITARALPADEYAWARVLEKLPPERQQLVRSLRDSLVGAPILGTLLKVEQRIATEIRHSIPETVPDELWYRPDALGTAEAELLSVLQGLADEFTSTTAERLLAAEAGDAIRFVEATRRRYDIVLMNPPFGQEVPETKTYLRAAYRSVGADVDLFAAFVARGLELCSPHGYLGAITSRAGMFLTSYEKWRREVLLGHHLIVLADLGFGVMEQALVEAATYVVGAEAAVPGTRAKFLRLLRDTDRPAALAEAIAACRSGRPDGRVFDASLDDLEAIPGAPTAYWMHPQLRNMFAKYLSVEKDGFDVRQGLSTADDFRYLRAFWEVRPERVAVTRSDSNHKPWVPFSKGGEYSPFWSDIHLLINWANDGESLRQSGNSAVRNAQAYFKPGLTWPRRTASGFNPRFLPQGCIFGDHSPLATTTAEKVEVAVGALSSRPYQALMGTLVAAGDETTSGTAAKTYEVGLVKKLPSPMCIGDGAIATLATSARNAARRVRSLAQADETARDFVAPGYFLTGAASIAEGAEKLVSERLSLAVTTISESFEAEQSMLAALEWSGDDVARLDDEVGAHPGGYPDAPIEDEGELDRLFQTPLDRVIRQLIVRGGGSRNIATMTFIADRRLEVLAHALRRHPERIVASVARRRLLPADEPRRSTADVMSYLLGVAFGRWDVRVGRDPSRARPVPGLLEPVNVVPPGMLVGNDGTPGGSIDSAYEIQAPPDRLLIDEPGHPWDIEAALRRAAERLTERADSMVGEVEAVLGRSLRDHLRRQFFKDHLTRYSKGRRQAPIYWWLCVPSRAWGVWAYAPALSREMLFAIARHASRRLALGRDLLAAVRADHDAGGRGRTLRDLSTRIAEEEDLAVELEAFRIEAERIAGLGWEPDLDDGLVLCAAPLARLFPSWPAASEEREKLRTGSYEWATVAHFGRSL